MGSLEYLYLVLISGIFSYLITYMTSKKEGRYQNTITLGASGIFYGFLGAIVTLGVVFQGPFLMVLKQFIPVIAINVVFTLADKNISKTGHLGGFVGGVIAMLVLIGSGLCVY